MKEYYERRAPEYERFLDPRTLIAELGDADVVHAGRWFVAVCSPALPAAAAPPSPS